MTRRDWNWLAGAAIACSADVAEALQHARHAAQTGGRLQVLSRSEAQELETLASRIIPSDDGPGAKEAGVVFFIDRALATFDATRREVYREGLAEMDQQRLKMFPNSKSIPTLSIEQQTALLQAVESTEFFEQLRTHTVLGFLGNPSYGGNRSGLGWSYIHFEDRMGFQPPFGFYDAEAGSGER